VGNRLTVGSIAGIEIRIHISWVFIALLIGWSFWSRFTLLADREATTAAVMAAFATVLFFGSVLVHELAHSLEAQQRGAHVSGITLFLFGGATETRFDVDRPRDEFALTAVGPFSSFVLAAGFGLVAFYSAIVELDAVSEVAGLLGWLNLALGVFNLFPGAPLDGGRILRSIVWAVTGDRGRGVRVASRSGQVLGALIATLGLLAVVFVPGALLGGLWFVIIGMFLAGSAKSEILQHEMRGRLQGVTVGQLVGEGPLPTVDGTTDLASAAERLRRQSEDALVVTRDGATSGILLLDDVAAIPHEQRGQPVAEWATPLDRLQTVDAETELVDAMTELGGNKPVAVLRGDAGEQRVEGIITPERLERVIRRTMQLGAQPRSAAEAGPSDVDPDHLPEGERS